MKDNSLQEIEEDLTQQVQHISIVSYLEGSIETIEVLYKSFSTFKQMEAIPLDIILNSLNTLKKDQNERLEGIKKIHEENKRDTF